MTGAGDRTDVETRRRPTLTGQLALLTVGAAVVTVVLAGLLTLGLTRSVVVGSAATTLARIADDVGARAEDGVPAAGAQVRVRRVLRGLGVQSVSVRVTGVDISTGPLATAALTPERRGVLLAGERVSGEAVVEGSRVLLEGRPMPGGGILLVQRVSDATATSDRLLRRVLLALLLATTVAVAASVVVSRRIALPLRRTATAARQLAAGRRDLTVDVAGPAEVAEVATALNTLSSSLSRSETRQRDFLLSISHDLRTPLTGIRGYAESLATGVVPVEQTRHAGEVLVRESARLERLVADLLDLARLRADRPTVQPTPVDLVEFGREAESVWQPRCVEAGVAWRVEHDAVPLWVRTDPVRLRQLVDGLLENALRVTPTGRPIVLATRALPSGTGWVVEVRDGGPGLDEEDLAVAFEPSALYEKYRGVRPVGTGLGLAIVARLATLLGGTVSAGHAPEGGARFTVAVAQELGTGASEGAGDDPLRGVDG